MRPVYRFLALLGLIVLASFSAFSQQSVSIGTNTIDRDAVLFLLGDGSQGIMLPKTSDLIGMPKKAGMVVYNETDGQVYSCDGNTWTALGGGATSNSPVLQLNGNELSIFTGVNVNLATTPPTVPGQILMWDGTKWTVTSTTQPANGDVLTWNGNRWQPSGNQLTGVNGTAPVSVVTTNNVAQVSISNITNNEISNTAAIADSKLATISTAGKVSGSAINSGTISGSTSINTTGTINAGPTTVSGLTIGTSTWPANATGVLTNNGTGTLSWAPASASETDPTVAAISGIIKSNGTTISAATAGTDYQAPLVSGTNIKTINGTSVLGAGNITAITTETDPTVTAINGIVKSNGTTIGAVVSGTDIKTINGTSILGAGNITAITAETDPSVTAINGLVKSNGTTISAAAAGTDYQAPLVSGTNIKTINGTSVLGAGNITALTSETDPSVTAINGLVKSNGTTISAATAGTDYLTPTGNGSGLTNLSATNIASGTLSNARLNIGTAANQLVQLDGTGRLPAVDGSQLTNLPAGTETDPTVTAINGLVKSNGTTISAATAGTDYLTPTGDGSGLTNLSATNIASGTLSNARLNVGTAANQLVQLDGTGRLPAVDGSQLTNLPAGTETDPTVTAINGLVKSNGTTISAATAGTDYLTPTGNGSGLTNLSATNIASGTLSTARLDAGTGANQIVQLDGTGRLPAVDGSQLTNLPAGTETDSTVTAINGLVKSNGTTISAAAAGTDYQAPLVSGTNIKTINGTSVLGAGNITAVTTETDPSVTAINGLVKSNGTTISAAVAGTDYLTTNQTITLSGDLGGSGSTAISAAIATSAGNNIVAAINDAGTAGTINDARLSTITTPGKVEGDAITTGTIGGNTIINTTGSINAGAATVSGLTIGATAVNWPTNGSGSLTNDGSGNLTWVPAGGAGTVTSITKGVGLVAGADITTSGTLDVNVGTGANQIVQLDGTGRLPAVDGSQLTNLPAGTETDPTVTAINGLVKSNGTTISAATAGTDYLTPTGDGSGLTNLSATNIASGTLSTARLDAGTGANQLVQLDGTGRLPAVDGSQLINLPVGGDLLSTNNLSELTDQNAARANLGLGTVATVNAIADAEVSVGANIQGTKINPDFGTQNIVTTGGVTANTFTGDGSGLTNVPATVADGSIFGGPAGPGVQIAPNTITLDNLNPAAGILYNGSIPNSSGDIVGNFASGLSLQNNLATGGNIATVLNTNGAFNLTTSGAMNMNGLSASGTLTFGALAGGGNRFLTIDNAGIVSATNSVLPAGISGQTLRHDGTEFIATSNLYNDGTNVGIGTAAPTSLLTVAGATSTNTLTVGNPPTVSGASIDNNGGVWIRGGSGGLAPTAGSGLHLTYEGTDNALIQAFDYAGSTAKNLVLQTNGGNVGIGINAPSAKLDVLGDVRLEPLAAPGVTTDKLYNVGGSLFWNGTNISSGAGLPAGTTGQTLRHDGISYVSNSNLTNDGTTVSIGNTTAVADPQERLRVGDGTGGSNYLTIDASAGTQAGLKFMTGGTETWAIMRPQFGDNSLRFTGGGGDRLTLLPNGNLGVGTSTPSQQLSVTTQIGWGGTDGGLNRLQTDQGGSIEIGGNNSTANPLPGGGPYLDFHYGTGAPEDFNMRISNTGDRILSFVDKSTVSVMTLNNLNVGIGTITPVSKLDVAGDVHLAQGAAPGTVTDKLYNVGGSLFWNGTNISSGSGWGLTGNAGTNPATNFIGTTDAQPLRFATGVGGVERMRLDATGNLGFGLTTPLSKFHIKQSVQVNDVLTDVGSGFFGGGLMFENVGTTDSYYMGYGNGGYLHIGSKSAGNVFTGMVYASPTGVGIFSPVPTERLDVTGNVKFSGALMPNNLPGTAGQVLTSAGPGLPPTWSSGSGWALGGNAGTIDGIPGTGTNYIGTTDNVPLNFMVNNTRSGRIDPTLPTATFFGISSGQNNTGVSNTGLGYFALAQNTTGAGNTAVGTSSLSGTTTGGDNTAMGNGALFFNTTGSSNAAFGQAALSNSTTASGNTGIGNASLQFTSTGQNNTALGGSSGITNTVGNNNTFLGSGADATSNNLTNATAIGYNALVGASNSLALGGTGVDAVNVGIGTTTPRTKLQIGNRLGLSHASVATFDALTRNIYIDATDNPFYTNAGFANAILMDDGKTELTVFPTGAANGAITIPTTKLSVTSTGVGINTGGAPAAALDITGNIKIADGTQGVGKVLTSDATGLATWQNAGGGAFTGSAYQVPRVNAGATAQEASSIFDNGSFTGIGTSTQLPGSRLTVNGGIAGGYGGMDIDVSGAGARPYYGFAIGGVQRGWINQEPNYDLRFWAYNGVSNELQLSLKANGTVAFDGQEPSGVRNFLFGGGVGVSTGNYNIVVGNNAGLNLSSGSSNVLLAPTAGSALTSGSLNVFIGEQAGASATGDYNTSIGTNSNISVGISHSTAIGADAIASTNNSIVLGSAGDNVGIGTSSPTAKLDIVGGQIKITDGTQGAGKVLTSDVNGLATWQNAGSGWGLTGNTGTNAVTDFVGTTDAVALKFRVGNQPSGIINNLNGITGFGFQAGNNGTGLNNSAFGSRALAANTGDGNSAFGALALEANTNGLANTSVGYAAMRNLTGNNNTAVGNAAMENSTNGGSNVAVGYVALLNNNADGNTALGAQALENSNGQGNTGIGYRTLAGNTTGTFNIAIGHDADVAANNLTNAIAIGSFAVAGASNTMVLGGTGANAVNVGIGTSTPNNRLDVEGGENTGIEISTTGNTIGLRSAVNSVAGAEITTTTAHELTFGTGNSPRFKLGLQGELFADNAASAGADGQVLTSQGPGFPARWENATGGGWGLLGNSGTIDGTNFIGTTDNIPFTIRTNNARSARIEPAASGNSFFGFEAGLNVPNNSATTAIGYQALSAAATGSQNTAIGYRAMNATNGAIQNVAVGMNALLVNTTGSQNAAVGYGALTANIGGVRNVGVGMSALSANTSGNDNVSIGYQSMLTNSVGNNNVGFGSQALQNTNANNNVGIGTGAGAFNTTGTNNTFLGNSANATVNNLTNATAIGANASVSQSNSLILGNSANVGIGTSTPNGFPGRLVHLAGTGNTAYILEKTDATARKWGMVTGFTGEYIIQDMTGSVNAFAIAPGGNVGIGTSSPGALLDVVNSANGMRVNSWLSTGASVGGSAYVGTNLYRNLSDNVWKYTNTHGSIGGAAIQFNGVGGAGTENDILFVSATTPGTANANATVSESMRIKGGTGYVGIGTSSPAVPLDVNLSTSYFDPSLTFFNDGNGGGLSVNESQNPLISVRAFGGFLSSGTGLGGGFYVISDERIKRKVSVSDSRNDLSTLMKLKVTDYKFVDSLSTGNAQVKGVFAQEVETVYPQAISKQTNFIPNVYAMANGLEYDAANHKLSITLTKPHGLVVGDKVKLISSTSGEKPAVVSAVKDNTFTVSDWTEKSEKVFVYGKEVNDFRIVDYDRLFTLNISATQELFKQIENQKAEIEKLKGEVQNLTSQKGESKITDNTSIEARLTAMMAEIEKLKALVGAEAKAETKKD